MNQFEYFISISQNALESEQEVLIVEKVIENIDHLYELTLADLAEQSFTSPTSIIRFVQRLRYESFTDFKEKVYGDYITHTITNSQYWKNYSDALKDKTDELNHCIQQIDMNRMVELAKLLTSSKSVTLISNFDHLENFKVLQITLLAHGIPSFKYKKIGSFKEHMKLLKEDDLVLYIQDDFLDHILNINPKPKKALLQVNSYDHKGFSEEETYLLIKEGNSIECSLLVIGQVFYYLITYVLGGDHYA